MNSRIAVALLLLVLSLPRPLHAQGTMLSHDSSWQIVGRQMTIRVAAISNLSGEDSPPLFLSVYAQPQAVYEGGKPGRLLARALIGVIPAGMTLHNTEVTTSFRRAGKGLNFTALIIEVKNGKRYEVIDYVAYTSLYSFGPKQGGGLGSDDFAIGVGDIAVNGVGVAMQRRRADFSIDSVQSQRAANRTGLLRVAIYATPEPFAGGEMDGKLVGTRVLGALAPGDYFRNLSGKIPLKRVGRGTQYFTIAVEEEREAGFVPVAFFDAGGT